MTKATSEYLNRPLRSLKQARLDVSQAAVAAGFVSEATQHDLPYWAWGTSVTRYLSWLADCMNTR